MAQSVLMFAPTLPRPIRATAKPAACDSARMIVAGLMSGTSIDAIDIAVADLAWRGADIVLRPLHHAEHPWPAATRARLLAALPPRPVTMAEVCALDVLVGEAFGAVAAAAAGGVPTSSPPTGRHCSIGSRTGAPAAACSSASRPASCRRPGSP